MQIPAVASAGDENIDGKNQCDKAHDQDWMKYSFSVTFNFRIDSVAKDRQSIVVDEQAGHRETADERGSNPIHYLVHFHLMGTCVFSTVRRTRPRKKYTRKWPFHICVPYSPPGIHIIHRAQKTRRTEIKTRNSVPHLMWTSLWMNCKEDEREAKNGRKENSNTRRIVNNRFIPWNKMQYNCFYVFALCILCKTP